MPDVQEILRRIGKHWGNGWEGQFSADWDRDNAENGFWLRQEDANAIVAAYAELQIALNPPATLKV